MGNFGKFGGGGGGMNMQQMMRQAQKMQEAAKAAQEELENTVVEGKAGGGMVVVRLTGKKSLEGVKIKPEAVDPDDVEMLEDLILAAFNEAVEKADELYAEKMGPLAGIL